MNGVIVKDRTHLTRRQLKKGDGGVYDARRRGLQDIVDGRGAILLHTTEGLDSEPWMVCCHGVSIHKLIRRDGVIIKMVNEWDRAWHAGVSGFGGRSDWNNFSIGYEVEHKHGVNNITDLQYEAVAQSIAYDTARFHIFDYWVRYHREVALPRGRKSDPTDFDGARMWRRVMEIRAHWPSAEWQIPLWYRPDRNLEPALLQIAA
ncbi:MAG TPA: N-acetylmuramoyl-L-alanine amidase [Chloroflexia bacterium]